MGTTALEDLAERTGTTIDELTAWRDLGLIGSDGRDPLVEAERVRLIRFLRGSGLSVDVIARVDREEGILDRFLPTLYPWSPLPSYSITELADRAGVDLELVRRSWRAAGFSEAHDAWSDEDVESLRTVGALIGAGLPEAALMQTIRVLADSLARVAEAEIRLVHFHVHERLRAEGLVGTELVEATGRTTDQLLELVEPTVLYFHRKGWHRAARDDLALHIADASDGARPADVLGTLRSTVVFTDLAGFTPLTEAMGDPAAAEVVERFSTIVRSATTRHHGRIVKQIGDEFMLVFRDPRAAVTCALEIDEQACSEPNFPAVHTGAQSGDVLYHEGDYVGTTVNVAARLAAEAAAHELLVSGDLADATADLPNVEYEPLGTRKLKGVSEEVPVVAVRARTASSQPRVLDPVCGMEMAVEDASARLEMDGDVRSFCSQECLQRFVAAPQLYQH
jgi:adenylate cyclase